MHPIQEIILKHKSGEHAGIFSVCCTNRFVIKAAMLNLSKSKDYLLVEATANQVDQSGGYTGMTPLDFRNYIKCLAKE